MIQWPKKLLLFCIAVLLSLTGCSSNETLETNPPPPSMEDSSITSISANSPVWAIDPACGGYEFTTDALSCQIVTDGTCRYTCFESITNQHKVELYLSSTEMIVLNTWEGITTYRTEPCSEDSAAFINPVVQIFDDMKVLTFEPDGSFEGLQKYCATETVQKQTTPTVPYTLYTLETTWLDGKQYIFQYGVYADGATLLLGDVPTEINPMITPDTTWGLDMDQQQIIDTVSGQTVPFRIVSASNGEGVSPLNDEKIITEVQHYTYLYVNQDEQRIDQFQMIKDATGAMMKVIYEVELVQPEITDDMTLMDDETFETALMLISMLESMF